MTQLLSRERIRVLDPTTVLGGDTPFTRAGVRIPHGVVPGRQEFVLVLNILATDTTQACGISIRHSTGLSQSPSSLYTTIWSTVLTRVGVGRIAESVLNPAVGTLLTTHDFDSDPFLLPFVAIQTVPPSSSPATVTMEAFLYFSDRGQI